MSPIVMAILGIIHLFIFITAVGLFYIFYKKQNYSKDQILWFCTTFILAAISGFFFANHFSFISTDSSLLLAIGYSIFPITQISLLLLSYPIIQLLNRKYKVKYAPVFLGIVASAPLSLLLMVTLAQFYWDFLGRSIYGQPV